MQRLQKICKTHHPNDNYSKAMGTVLAKMAEIDASKCYLDKQVFVDMMTGQCCDQLSGFDRSALD